MVIHIIVQLVCADPDLILGLCNLGEKLKKPFIPDQTGLMELVRHGIQRVPGRDLHRRCCLLSPVESAQVRRQQPTHAGQCSRRGCYNQHIENNCQKRIYAPPLLPSGALVLRAALCLTVTNLCGVPAGSIPIFIICH